MKIKTGSFFDDSSFEMLKRGASRQRRAIWALVFKEFKIKMGKSRIGLFWAMVDPIVGMVMLGVIRMAIGHSEIQNVHAMLFIGVGFVVFNAFRMGLGYIPLAIVANRGLLNYPQIKPIDTILARFIVGMWLHIIASINMLLLIWWVLGEFPTFPDPLLCIQAVLCAACMGLGISFFIAVFGSGNESFLKFVGIASTPLMILSGILYSMIEMPQHIRQHLAYNPIIHLVEAFRHGAFGTKLFQEYDLSYPLLSALALLGFGYAVYFVNRFKLLMK